MTNPYYNGGSFPATGSPATSASMRAELSSISAGFDKLPTLSGNASKLVVVNGSASALEATNVLPPLTITDSNFVVEDNADNTRKFRFEASSVTAGATRVLTVPDANLTLVGEATTQTLTNKTLNLASNTLVATSAQMAAAVTDETGSGALVFGTNPTISGATLTGGSLNNTPIGGTTPAAGSFTTLSASSSVTLSGGTANGVLYLNGSKVATSGTALAFNGTSLLVGKNSSDANNWGVQNYATNAFGSGMQLTYGGVGSAGLWVPAASSLAFGADAGSGTTELMRLTSTGLGIGTSSPNSIGGTVTARYLGIQGDGSVNGSDGRIVLSNPRAYASIVPNSTTAGRIYFQLLNASGGTTNEAAYITALASGSGGASGYGIDLGFYPKADNGSASIAMRLDSAGNLGLQATPSAWSTTTSVFENPSGSIYTFSGNNQIGINSNAYYNGTNWIYRNASSVPAADYFLQNGQFVWRTAVAGTSGNTITFSEQMRLTSTGLGIGTSSPGAKLDVATTTPFTFDITSTAGVKVGTQGTAGGSFMVQTQSVSAAYGSGLAIDGTYAGSPPSAISTVNIKAFGVYSGGGYGSNLAFWTSAGTTLSEKMRLDSSGNLGLGVTPSALWSGQVAFQVGPYNAVSGSASGLGLANNAVFTTSGFGAKYLANGAASFLYQNTGAFTFFTAPSGTAGNAISFTQSMTLDASGNLGIGTSSPGYRLTAAGASTAGSVTALAIENPSTNAASEVRQEWRAGGSSWSYITTSYNSNSPYMAFGVSASSSAPTERMRLDSSGNLGLGVTPSAWSAQAKAIQVGAYSAFYQTASGFPSIAFNTYQNTSNVDTYRVSANTAGKYEVSEAHKWFTAPSGTAGNAISFTQAMTLDASGRLAIGATSSTNPVTVVGTQNASYASAKGIVVDYTGSSTGVVLPIGFSWSGSISNQNPYWGIGLIATNFASGIGELGIYTGGTERARITSGGDLLVGTQSTAFTGKVVTLQATSASNVLTAWNSATTGDNSFVGFFTDGGTGRGSIDYNRAGGLVRYNTTSDYRAKDIIGPVQNPGATIDALKVYEGVMKGATQSRPMLIAHEAQEHAPYAVSGVKDEVNEDGTPKFQQMDVSSLVPLLLAEIQSLRTRVAALEAQP